MVRKIPPFKYSKVLPLVYDESLSYYEAISKITEKINSLIDYVQTYVLPTIDTEMSDTSENPVQNRVIKEYVDNISPSITVDDTMSDSSENAVQNKVIKSYVDNHTEMESDTISFDISNGSGEVSIADYIDTYGKPNSFAFTITVGYKQGNTTYTSVLTSVLEQSYTNRHIVPVPIVDDSGNLIDTLYVNIDNGGLLFTGTTIEIEMLNYDSTKVVTFACSGVIGIRKYV